MKKTCDNTRLPAAFKAMADNTRLKILLMLEAKPRTVGEIVDFFDLSQPTITRHLQGLLSARLVKRTRKGQHVRYELNAEHLSDVCVELMACFPCCCVKVPIHLTESGRKTKQNASRRTADKTSKAEPVKTRGGQS
ncbi:MAG: metalloregulator ArsR/SmtB family transcription factor [Candidatus Zixiibacteriota bacterium]